MVSSVDASAIKEICTSICRKTEEVEKKEISERSCLDRVDKILKKRCVKFRQQKAMGNCVGTNSNFFCLPFLTLSCGLPNHAYKKKQPEYHDGYVCICYAFMHLK